MKYSIIIPTHNRKNLLRKALCSVYSQTFKDYEVIIVVDNCIDGTEDYLYSEGIPYLVNNNPGVHHSRNLGIDHAKGEYLIFLDDDDTMTDCLHLLDKIHEPLIFGRTNHPTEFLPIIRRDIITTRFEPYLGFECLFWKKYIDMYGFYKTNFQTREYVPQPDSISKKLWTKENAKNRSEGYWIYYKRYGGIKNLLLSISLQLRRII